MVYTYKIPCCINKIKILQVRNLEICLRIEIYSSKAILYSFCKNRARGGEGGGRVMGAGIIFSLLLQFIFLVMMFHMILGPFSPSKSEPPPLSPPLPMNFLYFHSAAGLCIGGNVGGVFRMQIHQKYIWEPTKRGKIHLGTHQEG